MFHSDFQFQLEGRFCAFHVVAVSRVFVNYFLQVEVKISPPPHTILNLNNFSGKEKDIL